MAVFGAPIDDARQCVHAVDASREILQRLDQLNAAGEIHPTRIGIGLHMGEAVTGNVGSNQRKEYTIIGDVVNLASRLEQATKEFQARLLISDALRRHLDGALSNVEDLELVELKGQPIPRGFSNSPDRRRLIPVAETAADLENIALDPASARH